MRNASLPLRADVQSQRAEGLRVYGKDGIGSMARVTRTLVVVAAVALVLSLPLPVRTAHAAASETPSTAEDAGVGAGTLAPGGTDSSPPAGFRSPEEPAPRGSPRTPPARESYTLDDTVVVSGRYSEEAFRTDRSVSVVDRYSLLDEAPRTTPWALRESAGVFVQETNYGGGSPIVRGMLGPQLLILVDGVRFNNAVYRTGPVQYLNLLDPFSLDRIEVLRGPGSVLYGSDAMGGVIEVFPIEPKDFREHEAPAATGRAVFRYSSADRGLVGSGLANVGGGGTSGLAGVTYKSFDDLATDRGGGTEPYSGYDHLSTTASLAQRFSRWDFKLSYLFSRIPDAGRTDRLPAGSLEIYDNESHLVWGRVTVRDLPLSTRAGYTFSWQDFFERKDSIRLDDDLVTRLRTTRDGVTDQTMGHDLDLDTRLFQDRLRFQYGLMWYRDWVDSERRVRDPGGPWERVGDQSYPEGSTYDHYGGFLLAHGDPVRTAGGHVIRMGGGYRLHVMAGHAPAQPAVDLPAVDFSHTGHVFQASAQYLYRDTLNTAFTFSQGFRAPNLQEAVQLGDTGQFFHVPNEKLAPESSNTLEWLTRLKLWRLTTTGTFYVSFLDDLIKREGATWQGEEQVGGKWVRRNVNAGNGLIWGAEGSLFADLGYGLSLRGNITYTWGEEDVPDAPNVPLSRIPPLFGTAVVRYATGGTGWTGFAETGIRAAARQSRLSEDDERDARIPEGGTPGWWTWNLRLGVEMDRNVRVSLVAENLLDNLYKYHGSGIYASGVNVLLTVEAFL